MSEPLPSGIPETNQPMHPEIAKAIEQYGEEFVFGTQGNTPVSSVTSLVQRRLSGMVFQAMLNHPLPWAIEDDWTHSVESASGRVFASEFRADCEEIITLAESIDRDLKAAKKEIDAEMDAFETLPAPKNG